MFGTILADNKTDDCFIIERMGHMQVLPVLKTTISKMLKKQGVNVTKSKAQARLDAKVVIAMYEEMHTTEEIAERFKVNPQTILRCLRNHDVKIRSRWDYAAE